MSRFLVRAISFLLVGLLVAAVIVRFWVAPRLDSSMNEVFDHEPYQVSEEAQALHDTLRVADLHSDTLLWARDPQRLHDFSHTDLPRFRQGRTALQVFSAVTKSPSGLNYEENDSGASDDITKLALAQWWPLDTWGSIEARARYQARRLQKVAQEDDHFVLIRTKADLAHMLSLRAGERDVIGGVLATEGSHPLEGKLEAIDRLYAEGYRMMGLQHFFDNELGGSLHGTEKGGLTKFGREAVDKMEEMGIIIDVAHSSEAVVGEVLARTTRPIVISHTGIRSLCTTPRNIDDSLLREIAARGGLIGVGFWDEAVCDASPEGIAMTIAKGIDLFGEDAIALGSDFDGTVSTYFDVSELAAITDALLRRGLTEEQIRKVMGENQIQFFAAWLPDSEPATE